MNIEDLKREVRKKGWKLRVNQKGNYWFQVGVNKTNPLYLPDKWLHIGKQTPYIKKEFGHGWEVRAEKINPKTIYGTSVFYKSKQGALKKALKYMMEK